MSEKLSASDNPANREHMCAKQVVHEKWGKGDCIPTMHADPTEEGIVEWYDVMFPHGIETRVPTKDLQITLQEAHLHSSHIKKKKKSDEMQKNEAKMDPVDKKELKKKFDDREDGDIDNDGDEDESDKYLHMRRKAISKALKTKNKEK